MFAGPPCSALRSRLRATSPSWSTSSRGSSSRGSSWRGSGRRPSSASAVRTPGSSSRGSSSRAGLAASLQLARLQPRACSRSRPWRGRAACSASRPLVGGACRRRLAHRRAASTGADARRPRCRAARAGRTSAPLTWFGRPVGVLWRRSRRRRRPPGPPSRCRRRGCTAPSTTQLGHSVGERAARCEVARRCGRPGA